MPASPLDIELSKYWSLLSPEQKKSLWELIKLLVQSDEEASLTLQEPEAEYSAADFNLSGILTGLNGQQKEALLSLLESFGVEEPNQRISLEQYNKEIDEAEAEFERGEFVSHEEVIKMSKKWIHGR
jgi:hypothetical protein